MDGYDGPAIEQEVDSTVKDEWGKSLLDYKVAGDEIGDDLRTDIEKRSDRTCWGMLKNFGHPKQGSPNDIATWSYLLFRAGIVWALACGYIELTAKGRGSEAAKPIAVEDMPPFDNVLPFDPEGRA